MRVIHHTKSADRARFCREFLRLHAAMVRREIERRQARAEAVRIAHLALLSEVQS